MNFMLSLLTVMSFIANPQEVSTKDAALRNADSTEIKRQAETRLSVAAQEYSLRLAVLRDRSGSMKKIDLALDASILVFIEERNYHEGVAKNAHLRRMELIDLAAREQFPEYPRSAIFERFKALSQRAFEE